MPAGKAVSTAKGESKRACEQWIKEVKQAVKMARLSGHRFRSNRARRALSLLALQLGQSVAAAGKLRGHRGTGGRDAVPGNSGEYTLRQRTRIRGQGTATVASEHRYGSVVHRTGGLTFRVSCPRLGRGQDTRKTFSPAS
jgi:hypothetical protein